MWPGGELPDTGIEVIVSKNDCLNYIMALALTRKKGSCFSKMRYGEKVPSGVYFYRLTAKPEENGEAFEATRKLLLLK